MNWTLVCDQHPGFPFGDIAIDLSFIRFPQKAPKIVQDMSNVTVLLGEAASLKCQILAFPKPEVTWSREGQEIIELEGVKIVTIPEAEVLVSSELTIPNIKEEDGGMYRCKAVNALGEGQCEAEITVLEVPKILIELSDLRVNSGQVAQFICSFQEGSFSEVAWNHGDRRLEESERLKIAQNESVLSLTILNVCVEDHGEYSCTVSYLAVTNSHMALAKAGDKAIAAMSLGLLSGNDVYFIGAVFNMQAHSLIVEFRILNL
uniref:Ig-like domain-containing protein n=1 Tax=Callorhinchus milii TaxID=7868 RepID=A0A4W3IT18_CALMI